MKIIENKFIPFEGYLAMNICGVLFVRKGRKDELRPDVIRHESIHSRQWRELLWIFYLPWYLIEWFIKLWIHPNGNDAYHSIGFEREAYENEDNENYLQERKPYAWVKYIIRRKKSNK